MKRTASPIAVDRLLGRVDARLRRRGVWIRPAPAAHGERLRDRRARPARSRSPTTLRRCRARRFGGVLDSRRRARSPRSRHERSDCRRGTFRRAWSRSARLRPDGPMGRAHRTPRLATTRSQHAHVDGARRVRYRSRLCNPPPPACGRRAARSVLGERRAGVRARLPRSITTAYRPSTSQPANASTRPTATRRSNVRTCTGRRFAAY